MTSDSDLKSLIRARAAKTGESYQTARRHLLGEHRVPGLSSEDRRAVEEYFPAWWAALAEFQKKGRPFAEFEGVPYRWRPCRQPPWPIPTQAPKFAMRWSVSSPAWSMIRGCAPHWSTHLWRTPIRWSARRRELHYEATGVHCGAASRCEDTPSVSKPLALRGVSHNDHLADSMRRLVDQPKREHQ
jgi:hypothetical protein